ALQALLPDSPRPSQCDWLFHCLRFTSTFERLDSQRPADLAELLCQWEEPPRGTFVVADWQPGPGQATRLRAGVEAAREALLPALQDFLTRWRAHVYSRVVPILLEARRRVAEARRGQALLNYQDLLLMAAELLRTRPEVRAALANRFRWLLVDEFQDTDPVQAEILFWLAARPGDEGDWTRVRLRPGALFIVGDPKQSIYRFRRADIDTYAIVREHVRAQGGDVLKLTTSFRSVPSLIQWNNRVFSHLFVGPGQAEHQPLDAHDPEPDQESGLRTLLQPDGTGRWRVVEADARDVAATIRSLVDQGRREYGDFLILTRVKAPLKHYAAALEELGIPYELTGGLDYSDSASVHTLCELLETLADPDDSLRLMSVLRGPLFGLSDLELYDFRQQGGRFRLGEPGDTGPVAEALGLLAHWREEALRLSPGAAVERLLDHTGWLALAATRTEGGAEAGRLFQALDLVREMAARGATLADAARSLRDTLESQQAESQPLEPGLSDVVRVMNLHQAKGLEANVVFLAAPNWGSRPRVNLRVAREGTRVRGWLEVRARHRYGAGRLLAHPLDWAEQQRLEETYIEAEERRLLYVATTRAREMLVVSRWQGRHAGAQPWADLHPYLDRMPPLKVPRGLSAPARCEPPLAHPPAPEEVAARLADLAVPGYRRQSVTALVREGDEGLRLEALEPPQGLGPDAGPEWGTLVHQLLEHAMRKPAASREELLRLARWLTVRSETLARLVEEAVDAVERVRQSPFWRQAQEAASRLVEVPFGFCHRTESGLTVSYGVLDLALQRPGGWGVMDYKTDARHLDDLVQRYATQVLTYADLWQQLTGEKVAFAGLYGVRETRLSDDLRDSKLF
ncbi:MAG: UvrD-helicase domain-containing protein, partial [Candidatus Eremiobacterota bacterium]